MGDLTLITGGARSGKSRFAERLASEHGGEVLYLATLEPADDEMARRVEAHRRSRPASWRTVEEPVAVVEALSRAEPFDVCLLDCVTLWVSNLLLTEGDAAAGGEADAAARRALAAVNALLEWHAARDTRLIVVTNEVGAGLVPEYPIGRLFRDVLGEANQVLAAGASRVYLCVAGYAIDVRSAGIPISADPQ
jgi:adenosylcobinamide kinase/adenosylcobinamide-phosphate guanylyltransferase